MLLNMLFYYVFDIRKMGCPLLLLNLWKYERVNSLIVKLADNHFKRQLYNLYFSASSKITNTPTYTNTDLPTWWSLYANTCEANLWAVGEIFMAAIKLYIYIYIYSDIYSLSYNPHWECCINLFLLSCVISKLTTRMGKIS